MTPAPNATANHGSSRPAPTSAIAQSRSFAGTANSARGQEAPVAGREPLTGHVHARLRALPSSATARSPKQPLARHNRRTHATRGASALASENETGAA